MWLYSVEIKNQASIYFFIHKICVHKIGAFIEALEPVISKSSNAHPRLLCFLIALK